MLVQKRVESFLRSGGQILGLVGPPGSGKLYGTRLAAEAVGGFSLTQMDRAQENVNYNRLGACALGQDGLTRVVTVVCGADCETTPPDPQSLPKGTKIILIGNSCCPELKKAGIHVERINRATQDAMCKTLFLEYDWPAKKAKRLAALADGDWRRLWSLDRLFAGAGMDVAKCDDDNFRKLCLNTAKDKNLLEATPPSAAVHQLFSGYAASSNTVSDYAEHSVLMWTEANKDVVCNSLEQMADLQEAAVYADVLASGGQHEIGLETFARSAAQNANTNLRYDFTKYRNPWAASRETPESRGIRESWEHRGSWQTRAKRATSQNGGACAADSSEKTRPTRATKAKRAPRTPAGAKPAKAARL